MLLVTSALYIVCASWTSQALESLIRLNVDSIQREVSELMSVSPLFCGKFVKDTDTHTGPHTQSQSHTSPLLSIFTCGLTYSVVCVHEF